MIFLPLNARKNNLYFFPEVGAPLNYGSCACVPAPAVRRCSGILRNRPGATYCAVAKPVFKVRRTKNLPIVCQMSISNSSILILDCHITGQRHRFLTRAARRCAGVLRLCAACV